VEQGRKRTGKRASTTFSDSKIRIADGPGLGKKKAAGDCDKRKLGIFACYQITDHLEDRDKEEQRRGKKALTVLRENTTVKTPSRQDRDLRKGESRKRIKKKERWIVGKRHQRKSGIAILVKSGSSNRGQQRNQERAVRRLPNKHRKRRINGDSQPARLEKGRDKRRRINQANASGWANCGKGGTCAGLRGN